MSGIKPDQKAKVTLYWLEKSRSHRILWLLEELKLDYELKTFKRGSDMMAPPDSKKVHPLGKFPVISILGTGQTVPKVIAESALIVEYLTEYFGTSMIPDRFAPGQEGLVGAETESWLRYRYYMHYAEGSIMPLLIVALVMNQLKGPSVPFFVRPLTKAIAGQVEAAFLTKNFKTHFDFLEDQIATSPESGQFLCGPELTGADIMMIFPLESARGAGLTPAKYPKLSAYIKRMHERSAYVRAIKKIEDVTGEKFSQDIG